MDYCGAHGIPHSRFLAWDRDDRDKAIVWMIRDRQRCPQCGTRPDEWDRDKGGHDFAYNAELHRCWGCRTKAVASRQPSWKAHLERDDGAHVILTRNPEAAKYDETAGPSAGPPGPAPVG
jgi:hypothetical protein